MVAGGIVGGIARIVAVLLGVEGVAGAVSRPGGVEGTRGVSTAVRLRLVGDRYGPLATTITSFAGWRSRLLASVGLSAVGGRARLLVIVGGSGAAAPRSRAVAARGALGAPAAAVGIPVVV